MGRDRSRVLALGLAYLGAMVAALSMDWFALDLERLGLGRVEVNLRGATHCGAVQCEALPREVTGGGFFTLGPILFWGTAIYTLFLAYQVVTRVASGLANAKLSRGGIYAGLTLFAIGVVASYVLDPEAGGDTAPYVRTLAPMIFLAAHVLGIATLHYAGAQTVDDRAGTYVPVVVARKPTEPPIEPAERVRHPSAPIVPLHMKKKLRFVVLSGEVTRAGFDARREDGSSLLVLWRDVVGVVVRRLPDELDATTFMDIVSVKGSTLRILPWTKLTGISVVGQGDDRLRAVAGYVMTCCPTAQLDPATRSYLEKGEPGAQLKDIAKLAAHDERLS